MDVNYTLIHSWNEPLSQVLSVLPPPPPIGVDVGSKNDNMSYVFVSLLRPFYQQMLLIWELSGTAYFSQTLSSKLSYSNVYKMAKGIFIPHNILIVLRYDNDRFMRIWWRVW